MLRNMKKAMFLSDGTAVYAISEFKKQFFISIWQYTFTINIFCYIVAMNFCGTPLLSKLKLLYFFSKILYELFRTVV